MRVVHSPLHAGHNPEVEVFSGRQARTYEVRARAEAIRAALAGDAAFDIEPPVEHGPQPILAVHDAGLVRYLESAWAEWRDADAPGGELPSGAGSIEALVADTFLHPGLAAAGMPLREPRAPGGRIGFWCFDTATAIVEGTWPAARAAVDVALTAADAVLAGEPAAYGLCRPPGHHAGRAAFGGYCFLNNAAIATQHLVAAGAGRVGILDLDFHHGNGTQAIFWERRDVPYASLHGDPDRVYPYLTGRADEKGGGPGTGSTFNQPLAGGTDDAAWLAALDRALDWLGGRHDGFLVVSLGIDTYGLDPICDFSLTPSAYDEAGRRVAATGARLVVLQEGGYHLPDLGANVRLWLRGALGLSADPGPGASAVTARAASATPGSSRREGATG